MQSNKIYRPAGRTSRLRLLFPLPRFALLKGMAEAPPRMLDAAARRRSKTLTASCSRIEHLSRLIPLEKRLPRLHWRFRVPATATAVSGKQPVGAQAVISIELIAVPT